MACALVVIAAAAAVIGTPSPAEAKPQGDLGARLAQYTETAQRSRRLLRFFDSHGWLLTDARFAEEATRQLELHTRALAVATRKAATTRSEIARRTRVAAEAKARRLAALKAKAARAKAAKAWAATPRAVICRVFGEACAEALRVARCESRLRTEARNGQYRGLFQMGSSERELYGHGENALVQAKAAHRYYVASGRDWSPWSCKP